jgi:peptidoglycan/LPS O-acetylase OafA/YrhL
MTNSQAIPTSSIPAGALGASTPSKKKSSGTMAHVPQLDGIRAIAVLTVFIAHAGLANLVPGGFGVTIFFFLSGYLITSLLRSELQSTGTVSLKGFYIRRSLRILPPLYLVLSFSALCVAAGWLVPKHPVDKLAVVPQILFFQNYSVFTGHTEGLPITGIWSLSVEEHFYLLFPLVFLLYLRKLPGRKAVMACLWVCAAVLVVRCVAVAIGHYDLNYQSTHTRVDSILFGCCLALWRNPALDGNDSWSPKRWQAMAAVLTLLLTLLIRNDQFRESVRYTIQSAALFVLFAFALQSQGVVRAFLSSRILRLIGLYSYTVYLVHVPIMRLLDQHVHASLIVKGVLAFLCSVSFAALMYVLVERPLARLRRRLHHEGGSAANPLAAEVPLFSEHHLASSNPAAPISMQHRAGG